MENKKHLLHKTPTHNAYQPQANKRFTVIEHTFLYLPKVGKTKEQTLWKQGICTWKDFLQAKSIHGIADRNKPLLDLHIKRAQQALHEGNSTHFCCLPSVEQWRLWKEFREDACFVDIETNHQNNITVLGISDGTTVWQFVRHHNLDAKAVKHVLSQFKLIVTFNGASFDLPIIRRYFTDVIPDIPHIDLRHAGARAGLVGGLKRIEQEIGIARPGSVEGVSGADALKLWSAYRKTGNKQFLDVLLEYNAEDILNLKPLADHIYARLADQTSKLLKAQTP